MSIKYKTEGSLDLACVEPNSSPVAIRWVNGHQYVTVHNGGCHVQVSRSQLLEFVGCIPDIVKDLSK